MDSNVPKNGGKPVNLREISPPFFLLGLLNEFNNSFQTVGDAFFVEISWKQCFLLNCIPFFPEPPTIKELAALMGTSHQNTKQILVKLEKIKFVQLTPDPSDRRKLRVTLTEQAETFRQTYDEPSNVFMKKLFQNVSGHELQTTIKVLMQLSDNLNTF